MFNVSPIAETVNAPVRQAPRDVTNEPTAYLPPTTNIVECLRIDPVTVEAAAPLSRKCDGASISETTEGGDLPPAEDLQTAEQKKAERAAALAPPRISETCKFSSDERQKLQDFRSRLINAALELEEMRKMILDDDGSACGLAHLRETQRVRLGGSTFSLEDARRELCSEWLCDKIKQYKNYVDSALADELETSTQSRSRNTSARSSPVSSPALAPKPWDGTGVHAFPRLPPSNGYTMAPVQNLERQPGSPEQAFSLSRVPVIKPLGI